MADAMGKNLIVWTVIKKVDKMGNTQVERKVYKMVA
jgi:hypothetical protein